MRRTELNRVRLWSNFGATTDSDGILALNLIREGQELCPNRKALTNISLLKQYLGKQIQSQGSVFVFTQVFSRLCTSQIEASTSPPPPLPGHLTPFPAREGGGDLIILVFPVAGHLITSYRGGEFDR